MTEVDNELREMRLPLEGLTVIDMTTIVMGPSCTQALGEMGANVIKVEPPEGDSMRSVGAARHRGMGANFLNGNHSKRSLAINLKQPAGRAALLKLIERADVLAYNVRPQAMERLGLSWEEVSAVNPRLIYAGLLGYGQAGEYASFPAYDDLIQGASGMSALFYESTGEAPAYVPSAIADRITGMNAIGVILAAVIERDRSGLGQRVEVTMFETMVAFVLADHFNGLTFSPPAGEPGYARQLSPNRRPYRTLDGYISVLVYNDKQWRSFLRILGREQDFTADPRYGNVASRLAHIDDLYAEVQDALALRSSEEWLEVLRANDIPAMPVHDLQSIFSDPHLLKVGFFENVQHPTEGELYRTAPTSTWSRTQPRATRHAPRLGEHSAEVLLEAGLSNDEIDELMATGVLSDAPSNI